MPIYTPGPAISELLLLRLLYVRGTTHVLRDADQSRRRPVSCQRRGWRRQPGVWPDNGWCTRHATLWDSLVVRQEAGFSLKLEVKSHCDVIRYSAGHAHRHGRTNVTDTVPRLIYQDVFRVSVFATFCLAPLKWLFHLRHPKYWLFMVALCNRADHNIYGRPV